MKLTVKLQAMLILVYFILVHLLGLLGTLTGYIKQHPETVGIYMLLSFPGFMLIYFKQHLSFSSKLEEERRDLFDKNVQINPFAPDRKWFMNFSSLFSSNAFKSLSGELALQRILVRNCFIYLIVTFVMIALVGVLSIP